MEIIYKDNLNFKDIDISQYSEKLSNLSKYICKENRIGRGTYCTTYKVNDDFVLKYYPSHLNYVEEDSSFSIEINSEIDFIKTNNNLDMIANTYLIICDNENNLYILQEYLKVKPIINILYTDFIENLSIYIKILHMNLKLLEHNYVNIDIKPTNIGFDSNGNYKLFDMNLLLKLDPNNKEKKVNLYNKYDYYYLHPVTNILPRNIISYSIGILILEAFSTGFECKEYLYEPKKLYHSKFLLLNLKKKLLGKELFKILHLCFSGNYPPDKLLEKFVDIYQRF